MKTHRRISKACAGANVVVTLVFVVALFSWFAQVPDAQANGGITASRQQVFFDHSFPNVKSNLKVKVTK